MATFETQIEGLTGLAIDGTSNPTQDELSQFLTDGAKEVINRLSKLDAGKMVLFSTSVTDSDNSGVAVDSGIVVDVVRADGVSASNLRPADMIPSNARYRITDSSSILYRSKYSPAYYILNGKVFVVPAPSDAGVDKAVVSYVTYPTVAYGDSSIGTSYKSASGVTALESDPTVFEMTGHSFINGDVVKLSDFTEMTEANGLTG